MIRAFQNADLEEVMELWLHGNLQAHNFIPEKYWREHVSQVKEMLPKAELYIYENQSTGKVEGFVGMMEEYLAGIFVREDARSQGVGAQLLRHVKERKPRLALRVYERNSRAVRFYLREGFQVQAQEKEESTGEREYVMAWEP
ncbi:MAG: N-acetyltransferase [Lachnospiraceae bacterium]|nr:N-acetyltransferase [Lachnospiraceae bacterium]